MHWVFGPVWRATQSNHATDAFGQSTMNTALGDSVSVVAYLALFAGTGFAFVFANLLIGWLLRPSDPHIEKLEIYECGEPTIGSSFVQFDLRFYVVALIFIIFDVEVAFLFPWATVVGKADALTQDRVAVVRVADDEGTLALTPEASGLLQELGVRQPAVPVGTPEEATAAIRSGARQLLWLATVEVLVFFVILLIAFAYEWKLGALDWVRALTEEYRERTSREVPESATQTVLSA